MDLSCFTEEQLTVREAIGTLCKQFDSTYWQQKDQTATDPHELHAALAKDGWLGIALPEQYGGSGLGISEATMMMQTIAQSGAGMAGAQSIHANVYATQPLAKFGSKDQIEKTIPGIISGQYRTCFGVTEPNTGLDTLRLKTIAKREGDKYLISGQKIWITCAQQASKMILLARTTALEDVKKASEGLSMFCIDITKEAKTTAGSGIELKKIRKMGGNAVDANEVFFDNYEVPADTLIGEEGQGVSRFIMSFLRVSGVWTYADNIQLKIIMHGMNAERCLLAGEALGLGYVALEKATAYAKDRNVFGRPIGKNQAIAHPLSKAYMNLEAAKLATYHAARLYDQSQDDSSIKATTVGAQANAAKYLAAEAGFLACETSVMCHGGMGYAAEYDVERYVSGKLCVDGVSTDWDSFEKYSSQELPRSAER